MDVTPSSLHIIYERQYINYTMRWHHDTFLLLCDGGLQYCYTALRLRHHGEYEFVRLTVLVTLSIHPSTIYC